MQRFWAVYIGEKWFPASQWIAKSQGDEKKKAVAQVKEGLGLLEDAPTKCSKAFFGGEKIGYLDIALGCFLGWVRVTEKANKVQLLDEANTPGLFKWPLAFCSHAAAKEVLRKTDDLF